MFVPHFIKTEFKKLESISDPLQNLRSLHTLGGWISDMKVFAAEQAQKQGHTLEEIGAVEARPRQAVHRSLKTARTQGYTDPEFEGVSSSTLRYWLDWWRDPSRSPNGNEEGGRDPDREASRIERELEARYAAGNLRKPIEGATGGANG